MRLALRDGLPFVDVAVTFRGKTIEVPGVLVDTGSGGTVLSADILVEIGVRPEPGDMIHHVRGVGGREAVYARRLDRLQIGDCALEGCEVEVGAMDYGYGIHGILGMDVLMRLGAIVNLRELRLELLAPG